MLMSESGYSDEYKRILARRDRFKKDMETALADPDNRRQHPRPWHAGMVVHDGPGIQLFDAGGKPVLAELIRDPEDAAQLLHCINSGE
jgi:hypothetical protein